MLTLLSTVDSLHANQGAIPPRHRMAPVFLHHCGWLYEERTVGLLKGLIQTPVARPGMIKGAHLIGHEALHLELSSEIIHRTSAIHATLFDFFAG